MELELKHLSPYLPYGLNMAYRNDKGDFEPQGRLVALYNYRFETHPYRLLVEGMDSGHIGMFKPILRPISDLKESFNEEVAEFFNDSAYMFIEVDNYGISLLEGDGVSGGFLLESPLALIECLCKYHFDIYGLIKSGLAIDINTLKPMPRSIP